MFKQKRMTKMARMKSISTIEAEITRIKDELSKLQMKQDKLTLKLKELLEHKRNYEAKEIMDAYLKSGKSYEELMTFLQV
ncbi:hypothetical protein, partial [Ruminobacter sp. RM87]|uniref:hypothetical protein n=1 Tax=Ruminobacter sp. RM87 TaxID=1200567 RepID=UPI0004E17C51